MLKLKSFINMLLMLTILFYLHSIDSSIAGDCDSKGAGAGTPTVTGNYNYPPGHECTEDPDLEYDTANSDETIDRNGSATLVVIGNNTPYTWFVSGTGFTLENEGQPTGSTNTLYGDGTACGAATVTVTGCDGTQVTGYVRCTEGQWSNDDYYSSGCGTAPVHGCVVNEVRGHMRLRVNHWCIYTGSGCGTCNTNCEEVTGSPMDDVDISCNHPTYHECFTVTKYVNYWECVP